ncbi:molybdate ABC transporter substrate-binding protein [Elstera cyanobacteriorum]|uniref:molybdate ABC transporter substrate-binding protein n=1 Tax=Elstera cyanobacteriorum TaxID=2022747 RepID=UPI0023533942|nr:molybdate ABC transporter substrate-binding protein [Elstera cyanobacteriorum]MCK6442884.1 molybdate ABC transporter substrate-binding protein [Elstera cyanobacteriorum]
MVMKRSLLALSLFVTVPAAALAQDARPVTVFAAASLKNALDEIMSVWNAKGGAKTTASYAASSALAKQIENGAPADIFFTADLEWMDYAQQRTLIKADSRVTLLGNRLVLVAEKGRQAPVTIDPALDLKRLLKGNRLAMGEINSVPAGKYGKAALTSLGLWASVENSVAGAESVRAALTLVARGETPLGIVYQTDAAAQPKVEIVGTFPENSHPRILYPVALTTQSQASAEAFFAYLKSKDAQPAYTKQGFSILASGQGS